MDKELLKKIAKAWAEQTLDCWQGEWEAWDGVFDEEDLSEEGYEWIQKNIKFSVNVSVKGE